MIVNEIAVPLSEYCRVIGRIERYDHIYSASLSWTGEYFAGEEIIRRKWNLPSYKEAYDALCGMVAGFEADVMRLDRGVIRFSEGDNQTY